MTEFVFLNKKNRSTPLKTKKKRATTEISIDFQCFQHFSLRKV